MKLVRVFSEVRRGTDSPDGQEVGCSTRGDRLLGTGSSWHPDDRSLRSFGEGRVDGSSAERVREHLLECGDCRQRVAEMLGVERSARSVTASVAYKGTQSYRSPNTPPASEGNSNPDLGDHPDNRFIRGLGRGGMGVVYLAQISLMGRDEVLKVMGRQIMERPGMLERFLREIRGVARLRHPRNRGAFHRSSLAIPGSHRGVQ